MDIGQQFLGRGKTNPPLNAPTGFRGGNGIASASLLEDVWNLRLRIRVKGKKVEERRVAAGKSRNAIMKIMRCSFYPRIVFSRYVLRVP